MIFYVWTVFGQNRCRKRIPCDAPINLDKFLASDDDSEPNLYVALFGGWDFSLWGQFAELVFDLLCVFVYFSALWQPESDSSRSAMQNYHIEA